MRNIDKQKRLKASVLALALAMLPLGGHAAGLGKLTVVSALGQPLRAEIELTASREEYSSLSARLAPAEAFKSAGIEYSPTLTGIRFTLDRRPDGQPYLQVVSDRPLNEPFVDMLVEVNWASGRLVREYTFLLDPPDVFRKPAPAPVAVPEVKPVPAPVVQTPAPAPVVQAPAAAEAPRAPALAAEKPAKPAAAEAKPAKPAAAEAKPAPKPAEKPADKPAEGAAARVVKNGDTLGKIASEVKPAGVNLDQMLVALFRSNKDAFDAGNMNRLRAGKILQIPDREAIVAVEAKEARTEIIAQAADFNAYRQKLAAAAAAAPAREEAPKQVATGKITPRVQDQVPTPPAGKDKLEVSRAESGKAGAAGAAKDRIAAVEENLIARDKALKDAKGRIAELEKNLNDLKRLAELRSAAGSKLQDQAAAKKAPATPAAPVKPAEPPKAEAPPTPVTPPPPVTTDAAPKPAPKPVAPPPPPPPAPAPSFIEESPELVLGGGGIVALLLGYLGYNAWRRKRKAAAEMAALSDDSAAASVFGTTGGQTVDTGEDQLPTDFSQDAGADLAGDEGVDPVAEADVYIAYGRDSQAEEILLEALKTEPSRLAIHLKLLEIYAARKSLPQFEAVAREVYGLTAGIGVDWDKAVALGRSLDPANPLYGGTAAVVETDNEPAEEPAGHATQVMPGELAQMAAAAEEQAAPAVEPEAIAEEELPQSLDFDLDLGEAPQADAAPAAVAEPAADEAMSLDFDLDIGAEPAQAAAAPAEAAEPETAAALDFDLDLGAAPEGAAAPVEQAAVEEIPAAPAADSNSMDFDLGIGLPAVEAAAEETPAESAATDPNAMDFDLDLPPVAEPVAAETAVELPVTEAVGEPALDFDVSFGETAAEVAEEAPAAELPAPALDLSAISLELDEPAPAVAEPTPVEAPAPELATPDTIIEDDPEVATKFELAQAYEEMGDKEGARELLNEVLAEGSPAQQQAARDKLAQLG